MNYKLYFLQCSSLSSHMRWWRMSRATAIFFLSNGIRTHLGVVSALTASVGQRPSLSTTAVGTSSQKRRPDHHATAELFAVAPMMGHTHAHYRFFVRLFSQRAHLYTEMIPARQLCSAARRAQALLPDKVRRRSVQENSDDSYVLHPEEIHALKLHLDEHPYFEYRGNHNDNADELPTLSYLLGLSTDNNNNNNSASTVLQLGGDDPDELGTAAALGAVLGRYPHVNLNCGCPSQAVAKDRRSGAALMRDPDRVRQCLLRMRSSLSKVAGTNDNHNSNSDDATTAAPAPNHVRLSVKHRLGVRTASTFDAAEDRQRDDSEAYAECHRFVSAIRDVTDACQVHGRLALLGDFGAGNDATKTIEETSENNSNKVDHKRVQYVRKQRARRATLENRSVPPLRPTVVARLADAIPDVDFTTNGGIDTVESVRAVVDAGPHGRGENRVHGAMVGRAFINHPCSFAAVDQLWENSADRVGDDDDDGKSAPIPAPPRPTRGQVLEQYMAYCNVQEDLQVQLGASPGRRDRFTRTLAAVPFHLFVGEDGNDGFQRRLRKLLQKTVRIRASSMLRGAVTNVPSHVLNKSVDEWTEWSQIPTYEGSQRRSGALQRVVY